ncbi:hypothetical protein NN6n1_00860 [Shinella zoogloeoides]
MIRIDRSAVLIVPLHIAKVRVPLDWAIVTFVAHGHDVLMVEEEIEVALVVPLVMGAGSVRCLALPYQQLAAAVPLAGVVIAEEYPLAERLPGGMPVERLMLWSVPLAPRRFSTSSQ